MTKQSQMAVPAGVTIKYSPPPSDSFVVATLPPLLLPMNERIVRSVSLLIIGYQIPPSWIFRFDTPFDTPNALGCAGMT